MAAASDRTTLETLDGDGVRVQYEQAALSAADKFGYLIPGSEAAPLVIRADSKVILSTRFPQQASPAQGPSMIPLGMPWIVSIGDPMKIDTIGASELLNREASLAVSRPDADSFPDSPIGYEGVDLIVISSQGHEILSQLSAEQSDAIKRWVTGGGRMFVTLGGSATKLIEAAPWLMELIPLAQTDLTIRRMDPSAIETYTSSQHPLDDFAGVELPKRLGRILISGRTTRRVSTPLAAEYIVGLGRVTVVAADLDGPEFATWPERLPLIIRLTGSILTSEDETPMATNRATAFDDLAGQMRASLDQFPLKRKIGFSIVALILMALIAAIGPLDYLLVNRVFGRPLLGWVTFPIVAFGLSAVLIYQSRR